MTKLFVVTALINLSLCFKSQCQTGNKPQRLNPVPFITGSPVKLDGGCAFFADQSLPYGTKKSQLIIDKDHRAFIEHQRGKYAFFYRVKRTKLKEGYSEDYKGNVGHFTLIIKEIIKDRVHTTIRTGVLRLIFPGLSQVLKVRGSDDERDTYYKILYR